MLIQFGQVILGKSWIMSQHLGIITNCWKVRIGSQSVIPECMEFVRRPANMSSNHNHVSAEVGMSSRWKNCFVDECCRMKRLMQITDQVKQPAQPYGSILRCCQVSFSSGIFEGRIS